MKIKTVKIYKELKKGLPNYSNTTVAMGLEFEVKEDEQPDYNEAWDIVNRQLTIQVDSIDPAWIRGTELKDSYKYSIKVPKRKE